MTTKKLVDKWYNRHLKDLKDRRKGLLKLRTDILFDGKMDWKGRPMSIIPTKICKMCGKKFLQLTNIGRVSKNIKYCGCLGDLDNKARWIKDHKEEIYDSIIEKALAKTRRKRNEL